MTAGMPAGRKSSRARCLAEQREAIAPRFMSVVHCVHQPWVSVSNWATEQPAAIRGTAPTPGPMNCGTHFYRRVSQVTRGSRLRGTVRCTGIPPGQSPATAPSHFFYIAVRSQEHTRPHEWRTPFAYRLVLLPYSGVMQHILRVRAGTPPMPSARPGALGSAPGLQGNGQPQKSKSFSAAASRIILQASFRTSMSGTHNLMHVPNTPVLCT
jgi:hypothetical protein